MVESFTTEVGRSPGPVLRTSVETKKRKREYGVD